jgi:hypothetical protein
MYDVGKIARDIQGAFQLFTTKRADVEAGDYNLATPERIGVLLGSLSQLTDAIVAQRGTLSDLVPDAGLVQFDSDLIKWRGRLGAYVDAVNAAPAGDRAAILWSVTAPLLLGFYGGAASKLPQSTMDAATPFSLANQLEVDEAWRDERLRLFFDDLKKNAIELVETGGNVLITVGVAVGVAWAFKTFFLDKRR